MALENTHIPFPYTAGEDLRGQRWKAVKFTSAAKTVIRCAATTDVNVGILQDEPNTGEGCTVAHAGRSKAISGSALTRGTIVSTDAQGRMIAAAAGGFPLGMVEDDATAINQVVSILLFPSLVAVAA